MKDLTVKAISKYDNLWLLGYCIKLKSNTYILPLNLSRKLDNITSLNFIEILPESICKNTYVSDINGNDIYENDILESRISENKEDWKQWKVVYSDGSYVITRDYIYRKKPKYEEELLCEDNIRLYGLTLIGNTIKDNINTDNGGINK